MSSTPWEHTLRITDQEAAFLAGLLLSFGQPGRWVSNDPPGAAALAARLLEKLEPIAEAYLQRKKS